MTVIGIVSEPDAGHTNFAVAPTRPMDRDYELVGLFVQVDDDLFDKDAREPMLGARFGAGSVPGGGQILR